MASSAANPNFPAQLDIRPLVQDTTARNDVRFNHAAQQDAIEQYGIAGRIWEASHAMLAYLDPASPLEFDPVPFTREKHVYTSVGPSVIELGSGNGFLAARVASWLPSQPENSFVATDLPEVCPLLHRNLVGHKWVSVQPLAWGCLDHAAAIAKACQWAEPPPPLGRNLTHILCSDLVYFPDLLAPLLRTLLHLTSPLVVAPDKDTPTVIISYKIRSLAKETAFWTAFGLWFAFSPVLARPRGSQSPNATSAGEHWQVFCPGSETDDTFVFVARRRPESGAWTVPADDGALLAGVGARGRGDPQADGQFEALLLMRIDL